MAMTTGVSARAVSCGICGMLAGLILAWCIGITRPPSATAQQPARGEVPSMIAFTTATNGPAQLLYLIDTKVQAFAVYRVDPQKGAVKLEAARPYRWDLKLEYNNLPPEVGAVEAMVSGTGAAPSAPKH